MKKFALLVFLAGGMMVTSGCETPAYSSQERFQHIGRNWGFEYEQINDDIDHALLLRPATHLTEWDIQ
jgi:hypothetical protein